MKALRVKSVYSCYPLYQLIFGGNPALKYHEALCIAEALALLDFRPSTLIELFSGAQENRKPLELALGVPYTGVDLHPYKDNVVLDLSLDFSGRLPKTDLMIAGFRSIEDTVCNERGLITENVLTQFMRGCASSLNNGGLLWIDISGEHQDILSGVQSQNCSLLQTEAICKAFNIPVPKSRRATLEFDLTLEFDPNTNNNLCSYTGTLYTDTHSRDFIVDRPFVFRYWTPPEIIAAASAANLKLEAMYHAPEDFLSTGLLYPPIEYGSANKLVFSPT